MFWTAMTWGLGASLGGAVGLIVFFLMFWSLEIVLGRAKTKASIYDTNERSLEALLRRNDLSQEQLAEMRRLVQLISDAQEQDG